MAKSITIQFSVSEVSKLTSVRSPEVLLHGIPWEVEVKKYQNGSQKSLAAYLYCTKKEEKLNWKATACASIKLLPFSDDHQVIEHYVSPFVYHRYADALGTHTLIKWDDLLTKYVDNDSIQLEVKIDAEDPNSLSRSIPKFQCIDKSCECGCQATFELSVLNISNLMAVQSPKFIMRGMPWYIVVFKNGTRLGVFLKLMQRSADVSCQVTMSVKLVSSKKGGDPIEKTNAKNIRWPGSLYVGNLVSWNEVLKSENGFVNGNSIKLIIEIKSDKPVGDALKGNLSHLVQLRRFECSICLEDLDNQDVSATKCGHMFCTECVTTVIRKSGVCALCKAVVEMKDVRRMYLFAA